MYTKIKSSVFSKLILFFAVVLFIAFTAILIYSSQYLNQKAGNTLQTESIRAINRMNNYINEKYITSQRILASLYKNKYYSIIPSYLTSPADDTHVRQNFASTLDEFLQFHFSSDKDIVNIALEIYGDQSIYLLNKEAKRRRNLEDALREQMNGYQKTAKDYGVTLFPAYTSVLSPYSGPVIPMVCRIKSTDLAADPGCILVDFSCRSMEDELADYFSEFPSSTLYILDSHGTVIYDSSTALTGQPHPGFSRLTADDIPPGGMEDGELYTNLEYNGSLDLYFVSVHPLHSIYRTLKPQKTFIYAGIMTLTAVSLFSILLFSRQYFRRISAICCAIREIRSGNLTVRIKSPGQTDELSLISDNLNDMCGRLEHMIQEVYISQIEAQSSEILRKDAELKQRAAELYALQTQINPHFLYNTLESIRMRALSFGNRDVAQMVYLLSTLFKQSLKTGFVTGIPEELDTCRLYLELTSYRYKDKIDTEIEVDENVQECGIIRHILQPIIENALCHGLAPGSAHNAILIAIGQEGGDILIRIKDNGTGISPERLNQLKIQLNTQTSPQENRIGLSNVHQRITGIFGCGYGVGLDSIPGEGTTVTIRIPYMTVKEMENYVQSFAC